MRTRSPSMAARGMTATSGRHGRLCDGEIEMNQTSTMRNSPAKARRLHRLLGAGGTAGGDPGEGLSALAGFAERGRWLSHRAQTLNAANATASASRNQAHGRLE